jgi:hypothetical protein
MANFQLVEFTTDTKTYTKAGAITRELTALGYHFVNTGGCIVYINNLPLYPSGVLDTMYIGCKDKSLYNIRFDATSLVNPELTVITFNQTN